MIAMAQKTLSKWIDDLQGGTTVLIEIDNHPPSSSPVKLIQELVSKGYRHGIIVSLNVSCPQIMNACKGMEHKSAICFHQGTLGQSNRHDNCVIIPTLDSLTDLGILMVERIRSTPPNKAFCIIDSLSEMEKHNKPELIARFVQFINSKLKAAGIDTVMLLHTHQHDALKPLVYNLFDRVIEAGD